MAASPTTFARALSFGVGMVALIAHGGCGGGSSTTSLTHEELMDPETCKTCHPAAYQDWSGSMHAYASEDPVFRAMNQRAQRETQGALGDFCVKCHAPVAVQHGMTTDGLNLDTLAPKMKGVTCYFCHAAETVDGTHNNPLTLAQDDKFYGPFDKPASGTPHKAIYSRLLDGTTVESAAMCGSCHDIQNQQGAHVERTYEEWQTTLFAALPNGQGCADCHMKATSGAASTVSTKVRTLHAHTFPGVDLAVTDFPQMNVQRAQAQAMLDLLIQPTLCLNELTNKLDLTLENVTAGHGFPSGATPDRRAWIELTAYAGGNVIYSSGTQSALPLEGSADPDLWLMRDCLFDGAGTEKRMFWEAVTLGDPASVPGSVMQSINDPSSFNKSHPKKTYPVDGALPMAPDHVTVKVHLQAIGDDVLADLVQSGDLDPSIPPKIARYELGAAAALDWTPATAVPKVDPVSSQPLLCVVTPITYRTNTAPANSNARCVAPASP
jgi:hypothetical protein